MSTLSGQIHNQKLRSEEDLAGYFQQHAKPASRMRVGLESEFFGVRTSTGQAVSYEGPWGIEAVLRAMAEKFRYEPLYEDGHIIALQKQDTLITLEPGGQVELSAEPVWNVFEIEDQLKVFLAELHEATADFPDLSWLAAGIQPFSALGDISWMVPKKRYAIMWEYFRTHGTQSHQMMKQTATNQINFDYLSEENAMASLRVALGLSSIVSALFANSGFSEGRPNGYLCDAWRRSGR